MPYLAQHLLESPEALKMTAEAIELELRNDATTVPATSADIRALITELRSTSINSSYDRNSTSHPTIARFSNDPSRNRRSTFSPNYRNNNRNNRYNNRDIRCDYCRNRGHRQSECRIRQADRAHQQHAAHPPASQRDRYTRPPNPPRQDPRQTNRREHINAVQSPPTSWPTNADEQESTTGDPLIVRRKSHIPAWFFTLLCMFLLTTTTDTTISINTKPMLCQAHAAPIVYTAPSKYNCSFQLSDEKPGPDRATLQLFKRNIIKYRSTAKLCSRIETTVQRLTYFASVSYRERISTRHLPVSQTQCER